MSQRIPYLHSHSAYEREKKFPKDKVLIDERFKPMFEERHLFVEDYMPESKQFCVVRILDFVKLGGVFKNVYS